MINEEAKLLSKGQQRIEKSLDVGLKSITDNLYKINKTLMNGLVEKSNDDYWHYLDEGDYPGDEYDWVLVKICEIGHSYTGRLDGVPHIARFRQDGCWYALEWEDAYGTDLVPYEVICWRPIPGDKQIEFKGSDGKIAWSSHVYR